MRESWERGRAERELREGPKRGTKERALREREFKRELKGVGGRKFGREPHKLSLKQLYTVSTEGRSSR